MIGEKDMTTKDIKQSEVKTILKKLKILIITAAEPEKKALLNAMKPLKDQKDIMKVVGKKAAYHVGMLGLYPVVHAHCKNQGSVGTGGSMLTVKEALNEMKDIKICLMVGIAYGADENKQSYGDVLVSSAVQTTESVKISTGSRGKIKLENRNKLLVPGEIIRNQFMNYDYGERDYNIFRGIFLCGEKLVDNIQYKKDLLKILRNVANGNDDIIGGEMEGVGLAYSMASIDNLNWMIVKGISDFGDGKKEDDKVARQKKASENAVSFCAKLFTTEMLTQIKGVKTYKTVAIESDKELKIDPHVMFYYRNKRMLSFVSLSKKTGIPEEELREYETYENAEERIKTVKKERAEAIMNILDCNLTQEDESSIMANFYKAYKGRKRFYPVDKAKVVVFDFDGTLTRVKDNRSSWELIWLYLGYSLNDCGSLYRQFMNKEFDHQEWCDITARKFSQRDFKSSDMSKIAQNVTLIDGTVETLNFLKEKGIKLYICSGAMDDLITTIFGGEERKLFDEIVCNKFSYDRGGCLKAIQGTQYDFEGKADFIKMVIEKNKIAPEECIFIGNSDNDVWAYESGAKTLVVNPYKINGMSRKEWKYYLVKMDNLNEIIPFILPDENNTGVVWREWGIS